MTDWLRRVHAEGSPLVDGNTATFVWHGANPPRLVGDMNRWKFEEAIELEEVDPGVWIYQIELPEDAYLEYTYVRDSEQLKDPFNPQRVSNGFGSSNHYFYMPAGEKTPLTFARGDIPHGTLTRAAVETGGRLVGDRRSVVFYQPPVEDPVPLIVVWDGEEYLRLARLGQIVDNLIAEDILRPVALAMVANRHSARSQEYSCSEATLSFMEESLLPEAQRRLNLADPGDYGVMGSSLGGLMALYTGLRMPEVFGNVLSQSGSFSIEDHDFVVFDLVRYLPVNPDLKIWMDCGRYDELLDGNQRMAVLLKEQGYNVEYNEFPAGHNYTAWRDDLWQGLVHLYRKPENFLQRPA